MPTPTHTPEPDHDTRSGAFCLTCRHAIVRVGLGNWMHAEDAILYDEMRRQNG